MKTLTRSLFMCLPIIAVACQTALPEDETSPAAGQPSEPAAATSPETKLEYDLDGDNISGRFADPDAPVKFKVAQKDGALFDVSVEVNGLVLAALLSNGEQAMDFDGFASGTGLETQLRQEDRNVLLRLHKAAVADEHLKELPAGKTLEHALSLWSQMSDTYPLVKTVHVDTDRAYNSLCNSCGQFAQATHDCNICNRWNGRCTSNAQLGGREGTTESFINGNWIPSIIPDHVANLQQRGECYGNCGPGCPGIGDQQLTSDCHDHDQCVRNGHFIVSAFCDDEFFDASDDEIAAPSCGRYVAQTTTVACKATQNDKGWYVIKSCEKCPAGYSPAGYTNAGHPTWYPRLKCQKPAQWVCP